MRTYITSTVSSNTGHLASNLGTIELTIALYRVFDPEKDIIIWDTGHQSYTHKLLTGRYESFATLRQKRGISGFPRRIESKFDIFGTGHTGTSIAAALGIEKAMSLKKDARNIIVVIGDGAMTSGMSLEALNQLKSLDSRIRIIMNDNGMSIGKNVGSMASIMSEIRLSTGYRDFKEEFKSVLSSIKLEKLESFLSRIKNSLKHSVLGQNMFEDLGLNYIGPLNGHDIKEMEEFFTAVKEFDEPFFVHVMTHKGQGIDYAENDPTTFHSVSNINPLTGEKASKKAVLSYSEVFGEVMNKLASKDEKIVAITAAMPDGVGLKKFSENYPDRFIDLGITEQMCVTFAGGMATTGYKPVFAVYSTFLQRSLDQLIHDIALQNLPVLFCIDRAGIVGRDGATHNGIFDIAYMNMIPNFKILAPASLKEFGSILYTLLTGGELTAPTAIRYPRTAEKADLVELISSLKLVDLWKWEKLTDGEDGAILATGSMVNIAKDIAIENNFELYNCRSIKPLDIEELDSVLKRHRLVICMEEGIRNGGFGSAVSCYSSDKGYKTRVLSIGIDDVFSEHGSRDEILSDLSLDQDSIKRKLMKLRGESYAYNNGVWED